MEKKGDKILAGLFSNVLYAIFMLDRKLFLKGKRDQEEVREYLYETLLILKQFPLRYEVMLYQKHKSMIF